MRLPPSLWPFQVSQPDHVRSFRSRTEIQWTFRDFLGSRSANKFDDSGAAWKPWTSEDQPWNEATTDPFEVARTLRERSIGHNVSDNPGASPVTQTKN